MGSKTTTALTRLTLPTRVPRPTTSRVFVAFVASVVSVASMGCSRSPETKPDSVQSTQPETLATAKAWIVPPRDTNLTCTPEIGANDTLRMRMSLPHGPTFHIGTPDGTPYVVIFYGAAPDRGLRRTLMPPDSFAKVTALELDPRTFKAGVWVFGRDTNELVFTVPGTYRLRVGSDMETDGPIYAECLVRYRP
jgi:hypothetical protein